MKKNTIKAFSITLLIAALCISALSAGTTGKISGRVTDKASGEPLPGCNVLVEGTVYGAATDTDGTYFILNIPRDLHP
ncbi:MAG: carboxypeptidase-like regulatory domain-containing protein [Candidatus Marinimicrobia bacterium]|nr:carboxypeptidase-like regulatory domain-containing protein [Candidatus Neomarinimicrobiota bacterium]